jgi:hypothetical protein
MMTFRTYLNLGEIEPIEASIIEQYDRFMLSLNSCTNDVERLRVLNYFLSENRAFVGPKYVVSPVSDGWNFAMIRFRDFIDLVTDLPVSAEVADDIRLGLENQYSKLKAELDSKIIENPQVSDVINRTKDVYNRLFEQLREINELGPVEPTQELEQVIDIDSDRFQYPNFYQSPYSSKNSELFGVMCLELGVDINTLIYMLARVKEEFEEKDKVQYSKEELKEYSDLVKLFGHLYSQVDSLIRNFPKKESTVLAKFDQRSLQMYANVSGYDQSTTANKAWYARLLMAFVKKFDPSYKLYEVHNKIMDEDFKTDKDNYLKRLTKFKETAGKLIALDMQSAELKEVVRKMRNVVHGFDPSYYFIMDVNISKPISLLISELQEICSNLSRAVDESIAEDDLSLILSELELTLQKLNDFKY